MVTCDHCTRLGICPSHRTDSSKMPDCISVICGQWMLFICDFKKAHVCVLCYQEAEQCQIWLHQVFLHPLMKNIHSGQDCLKMHVQELWRMSVMNKHIKRPCLWLCKIDRYTYIDKLVLDKPRTVLFQTSTVENQCVMEV